MAESAPPLRDDRRRLVAMAAAVLGAPWPPGVRAEPAAAPLRLVVAYPPGGLSDQVARALAPPLARRLGVAVQVENQAGAGGAIALRALARSPPDGRTLVFAAITPLAFDASLRSPLPGAPAPVAPVASVMLTPSLLVGTPAFGGRRVEELLDQARARPGALRWATSGIATTGHLVLEQVCRAFRVSVTHVPYKGGGQQLSDALGGQFELLATNVGPAQLDHVRAGRFTPLAVGAPARLSVLPAVPTFAELGCPRANLASLFGLFAPGATPAARVEALNAALDRTLLEPTLRATLIGSGNVPTGGSAGDFGREIGLAVEGIAGLLGRER
jgi:tripartite-type tricarboxylate transporter receptor subunit TctC